MKKTLILTAALGLAGAPQLMAQSDLFITGSTAFRANVHDACLKLFTSVTEYTGTPASGGDTKTGNAAAQWTMTGTPIAGIGVSAPFTIHALFTGSVQGVQTVETSTKLIFIPSTGLATRMTNTATIAFSDVSSISTPYPATGNYSEEAVAVQPFVICKSMAPGGVTNINNVTWDQLKYIIQAGRTPLSTWTGQSADQSTLVYLLNRTKDSGTRRTTYAEVVDGFNASAVIYNYDPTNNDFYHATTLTQNPTGGPGYGVIGVAGNDNNNVSSLWGQGYVGGGDIKTALAYNNLPNQSIAYLSLSDAKGISGSGTSSNWTQVVAFNGGWPTAAGVGIRGASGTNDFTPISLGQYGLWAQEVVVYPTTSPNTLNGDQNLTVGQLGNQNTPGTILGALDAVTFPGNPVVIGSIDNEIENSKTNGATAIRIGDMTSSRASVGGTITP
jgi:hypothetical protein